MSHEIVIKSGAALHPSFLDSCSVL